MNMLVLNIGMWVAIAVFVITFFILVFSIKEKVIKALGTSMILPIGIVAFAALIGWLSYLDKQSEIEDWQNTVQALEEDYKQHGQPEEETIDNLSVEIIRYTSDKDWNEIYIGNFNDKSAYIGDVKIIYYRGGVITDKEVIRNVYVLPGGKKYLHWHYVSFFDDYKIKYEGDLVLKRTEDSNQ